MPLDEAGIAARNGCPELKERPENLAERTARYRQLIEGQDFASIRVDSVTGGISIDRLYFPTDGSRLNRPDRMVIEEIDRFLALPGAENFNIRFEGHADRQRLRSVQPGPSPSAGRTPPKSTPVSRALPRAT